MIYVFCTDHFFDQVGQSGYDILFLLMGECFPNLWELRRALGCGPQFQLHAHGVVPPLCLLVLQSLTYKGEHPLFSVHVASGVLWQ